MNDMLKRIAGPAAIVGGSVWLVLPVVAIYAPSILIGGVVGVVGVGIASAGVHIVYRQYRKGFYEEVGLAVLFLGLFATLVSFVTYSPANTDTLWGIILTSIPIVVAVVLLAVGTVVLGVAVLTSQALPVWAGVALVLAVPVDVVAYSIQYTVVGGGVSVFGVSWIVVGIAFHKN